MKTIKLPYKSSDLDLLLDLQRQYTILVKSGYNRILKGMLDKDIRLYLKELNNVDDLDSRFIENVLVDVRSLQKENKLIFRRSNFIKKCKNKISKEEFKLNKYLPLVNYGEKLQKGNRKFKIDLENDKVIFKLNRNKHIDLILPNLKQNIYKELLNLENLMKESKISVSFKIDKSNLFISYEPLIQQKIELKDNRILGIDLNPDNLGISILEFKNLEYEIIYKSSIDLTKINKMTKNKRDTELIYVSKQIVQVMKSFSVGNISIEDLSMKSKDHGKGKRLNKLLNGWNRNLLVNNLIKRSKIEGIKVYQTNAAYTSFVGNLMYEYVDSVNASIEIARRGYLFNKMFIKNSFYPEFKMKDQWNQWKEETGLYFGDWRDVYKYLKTLNMRYRVPIEGLVFRKECIKKIKFYIF